MPKIDECPSSSRTNETNIEEIFSRLGYYNTSGENLHKTNSRRLVVKCSALFDEEFLDIGVKSKYPSSTDTSNDNLLISKDSCSEEKDSKESEFKDLFNFVIYEDENTTDFNEFLDFLRLNSSNLRKRNSKRKLSTDEETSPKKIVFRSTKKEDLPPKKISNSTQTVLTFQNETQSQPCGKYTNSLSNSYDKNEHITEIPKSSVMYASNTSQLSCFPLTHIFSLIDLMIANIKDALHFLKGGSAPLPPNEEPYWSRKQVEKEILFEMKKQLAFIPPEFETGIESQVAKNSIECFEKWRSQIQNETKRGICYFKKTAEKMEMEYDIYQQVLESADVLRMYYDTFETSATSNHVPSSRMKPSNEPSPIKALNNVNSSSVITNNSSALCMITNTIPSPSVATNNIPSPSVATNNVPSPSVATNNIPSPSVATNNIPSPSVATNNIPSPSVATNNIPFPSVANNTLPDPKVTHNFTHFHPITHTFSPDIEQSKLPRAVPLEKPCQEVMSVEETTNSDTSKNSTGIYRELYMYEKVQSVKLSIPSLCQYIDIFNFEADILLRKIGYLYRELKKYIMTYHFEKIDEVILEEFTFHVWDLMHIIERLSVFRKDCSTLLKIDIDADRSLYILRVKYLSALSFEYIMEKAEYLIVHLESFLRDYSKYE